MKKTLILILLFLTFQLNYSQESFTINGETITLKTEIEGDLDLLWTSEGGIYRYFIRTKEETIIELKNTKDNNKNYLEEYKTTLKELTNGMSTNELNLRLYELKAFIDTYNTTSNTAYVSVVDSAKAGIRLGVFGGITNHPFVNNANNTTVPLIGTELEIFEANKVSRHAGLIQFRHTREADDFKYSTNEFSLGYRYRVINTSRFSLYPQVKLATVHITESSVINASGIEESLDETSFEVPIIFGLGTDIKVGKNGYITIIYGELFGLFIENQGNFSQDISIGYKLNL